MSIQRGIAYFLLSPVSLAYALMYSLVVLTRIELGYWPSYGNPDAGVSTVPFAFEHVFVGYSMLLGFLSGPIGFGVYFYAKKAELIQLENYAIVLVCAWLIGLVLPFIDPGGFIDWFWD